LHYELRGEEKIKKEQGRTTGRRRRRRKKKNLRIKVKMTA